MRSGRYEKRDREKEAEKCSNLLASRRRKEKRRRKPEIGPISKWFLLLLLLAPIETRSRGDEAEERRRFSRP